MLDEQLAAFTRRHDAYLRDGDPAPVLDPQAVTEAQQLWADNVNPDGGVSFKVVFVVAQLYWLRHQARPGQDDDDLRIAVDLFSALYETAPEVVPPEIIPRLADCQPHLRQTLEALDILGSIGSTDNPDALITAISLLQQAIPDYPQHDPNRAIALFNLGTALRLRFRGDGDPDLLRSAAESFRAAAAVPLPQHFPRHEDLSSRYADTLAVLAEATTSLSDLDAAIEATEELATNSSINLAKPMSSLCDLLRVRFEWTGDRGALANSVRFGRTAVDAVASDDPQRATCLSHLSMALRAMAENDRDVDAMTESVRLARAAVDLDPENASWLSNLSAALLGFITSSENPANVDEAINAAQRAVDYAHSDRTRAGALSNLAGALRIRYSQRGELGDLSRAIDALLTAEAVAGTAGTIAIRVSVLSNLGNAYGNRFGRTGDAADLDGAIRALRSAVELLTEGHMAWLVAVGGLSAALRARFELHRRAVDIDLAVQLARDAVTSAGKEGATANLLNSLGNALMSRAKYTYSPDDNVADIDEAIESFQAALARGPEAEPSMRNNLGGALLHRFHATEQQDDLDAAIDHISTALTLIQPNDPARIYVLSNLGDCHRVRFARSHDPGDLERAAALIGQALDHAPDHDPRRFSVLSNLGHVHETLMRELGKAEDDAMRAVSAWRAAAGLRTASAAQRFDAAQNWAALAAALPGEEALAADGYATAVEMLPLVAWHGLERSERENRLTRSTGLANAAAAAALRAGRPNQSVDLLEHGRAVQWTQALQLRADLATLHAVAPRIAGRLDAIRQELDKPMVEIAEPSWQRSTME